MPDSLVNPNRFRQSTRDAAHPTIGLQEFEIIE